MISIIEQEAKLPDKLKEFENHTAVEVAKELGLNDKQIKEIEQSVDKAYGKTENLSPQEKDFFTHLKNQIVKQQILRRYFVWGKIRPFILDGCNIKGLLGHIWLHKDIIHLLGNILFLWIFGNAVCAKIGNLAYVPIYIILGIFAAIAHLLFKGGAALGASGAIMGIVGIYLVFFYENNITCIFLWIYFFRPIVRQFTLSSFWMILFWLAFDIFGAARGGGTVAYFAHLGGFAVGFGMAFIMLKMRWVVMERYEKSLLQMWTQRKNPPPDSFASNPGMFPYDLETKKPQPPPNIPMLNLNRKNVDIEKTPSELDKSKDDLIRFVCPCGKKVKAPIKYAGKLAECPRCKKRVKIPQI
jgi:membrane associated rhomboid family serine protease